MVRQRRRLTSRRSGRRLRQDRRIAPRRYTGPFAALAAGTRFAYRNRQAIWNAGQSVRNMVGRKRAAPGRAPQPRARQRLIERAYEPAMTGNSLTKVKSSFKLKKVVPDATNLMMAHIVDRWNSVSNFDTNTGNIGIVNKTHPSGVGSIIPLLTFNLSGYNQLDRATDDSSVCAAWDWESNSSLANLRRFFVNGADNLGALSQPKWRVETTTSNNSTAGQLNIPKILMKSIEVKMNLYGTRKRDTKFMIDLVRIKDDECDFNSASLSNMEFKNMIDGLTKPLVWSNINVNESNRQVPRKKLDFIRSWTYSVPAASTDDINTTVGNIKEVTLNLTFNKIINYQRFDEQSLLGHAQTDGDDYIVNTSSIIYEQPNETSRMYLMVRAFAPERSTAGDIQALIDPSIDIIMKRRYTVPAVTTRY